MREIVGRKAKFVPPPDSAPPAKEHPTKGRRKSSQQAQEEPPAPASDNYVLELTVSHLRPDWRRRR
jgi:hypothetical protein